MIDFERSSHRNLILYTGRTCTLFILLVLALTMGSVFASAQELEATLTGTVTDTSGAVVPRANVSISQNGINGSLRTIQTDAYGNFVAPNLDAGTYTVSVSATGFENFTAKDVVLNVGQKRSLDAHLKAGSVTQTITVTDNPVSIDTDSSAQAGTISGTQIRELELSGRDFQSLVALQPGVVNQMGDAAGASNTNISVNGGRVSANNWTVDGADINDSGSNQTIVNVPSIDSIQEFTLQRGTYDAGYGRSGGGQILVQTKNGTSQFHGGVYEFARNTDFDAATYDDHLADVGRTPYHYNDYGFTIGGPVYIPHAYNSDKKKTFFFWSDEWYKDIGPSSGEVPSVLATPAAGYDDLTGGFVSTTAPVGFTLTAPNTYSSSCGTWNSTTGNGTINLGVAGCESVNAKLYVAAVYAPNTGTLANNAQVLENVTATNNLRKDTVRIDHYFNEKVHFFARGLEDDMPISAPFGLWAGNNFPGLVNTTVDSPGKNVVGNLTWAISNNLINEVEFVFAQGTYFSTIAPGQFASSLATLGPQLAGASSAWTDPYNSVPAISINNLTGFSAGSAPWHERNLDRTYFDNLTWIKGKHTLRAGFQFQQMIKTENAIYGEPSVSFADWGDFLLGNAESYSHPNRDIVPDLRYINSEAYVQDDWKVNHKLTLNLGVRWSDFPPPADVKNTLANFDPLLFNPAAAPTINAATGNFNPGQFVGTSSNPLVPATYTNGVIFPQGAACAQAQAVPGSQVQCSPYGSTINPNSKFNFGPRVGFAYNPDGRGKTSVRGGIGIFYDRLLNGIFEQNAFSDPPLVQTVNAYNVPFDNPAGNVPSYGPNSLIASGNPTFKVPSYTNYNLSIQHQVLPTTTVELAYVGNSARHLLGDVDSNQPTLLNRLNAGPNVDVNAIRPFLGYSYIKDRLPVFTNNYNSLQVSINHHAHGLQFGLAYTYSKDETTESNDRNTASSDTYDLKLDHGPANYNTPQILEINYVYELPFFKSQHGFEGKILGGWEVSGITSFVSGTSFEVTQPTDPFACSNGLSCAPGTGLGGVGIQQGIFGEISARPNQIAPVQKIKTVGQWFSTSSFAAANGQWGTEGSNPLIGPGLQDWDMAAIKNVKVGELLKFQLRGEFFNAFNHTNFSSVDSGLGDAAFGQVNGAHVKRVIQLGGKLNF